MEKPKFDFFSPHFLPKFGLKQPSIKKPKCWVKNVIKNIQYGKTQMLG